MNKAVGFTADSVEELAAYANKAALECGGELLSLQVLTMTSVEDDGYWFAGMALVRVPVVEAESSPYERARRAWEAVKP